MPDLLVLGGDVVTPHGVQQLDIAVEGERIAQLGPRGSLGAEAARGDRRDRLHGDPGRRRPARPLQHRLRARARGDAGLVARGRLGRHDDDHGLRAAGRRQPAARRDRREEGRGGRAHGGRLRVPRAPHREPDLRGDRGDRRRDPLGHPDDQGDDDLRVDLRRRPHLGHLQRGRRERRARDQPRRGRRDRELAHRQAPARGQDARRATSPTRAPRSSRRRRCGG